MNFECAVHGAERLCSRRQKKSGDDDDTPHRQSDCNFSACSRKRKAEKVRRIVPRNVLCQKVINQLEVSPHSSEDNQWQGRTENVATSLELENL